jgi:hypothetical protein
VLVGAAAAVAVWSVPAAIAVIVAYRDAAPVSSVAVAGIPVGVTPVAGVAEATMGAVGLEDGSGLGAAVGPIGAGVGVTLSRQAVSSSAIRSRPTRDRYARDAGTKTSMRHCTE